MVAFKIKGTGQNQASGGQLPASAGQALGNGARARSPRRRVLLKGTFHSLTSSAPAGIRNLSCTGASIECDAPLKIGAEGVLNAGPLDCLCRVIWQKGKIFGLKFDLPLPNPVVIDLHRISEADVKHEQSVATRAWFETNAR